MPSSAASSNSRKGSRSLTRSIGRFKRPSPVQLRKLPRELQERILAASAELAKEEYRTGKDLTDFEAFAEEP